MIAVAGKMKSLRAGFFVVLKRAPEAIEDFSRNIQAGAPYMDLPFGKLELLGRSGPDHGIGHGAKLSALRRDEINEFSAHSRAGSRRRAQIVRIPHSDQPITSFIISFEPA